MQADGIDPVEASLARIAQERGDIGRDVYERFAARHPEWAALMSHMDEYMLGRMMQDVILLLLTQPAAVDRQYLRFEVSSHRSYGVTPDMFEPMLDAVRDTLRAHFGGAWTGELDAAWRQRIDAVVAAIQTMSAPPARARATPTTR